MKIIKIAALIGLLFTFGNFSPLHAQVVTEENPTIEFLKQQKETVEFNEKEKLKEEIKEINKRVNKEQITADEGEELKKVAADKHAQNIENQLSIIDSKIALLERNAAEDDFSYYEDMEFLKQDEQDFEVSIGKQKGRTKMGGHVTLGLATSFIENQKFSDSPYKIGGSYFWEFGMDFHTALTKNGFLRLNYGLGFQFDILKPIDNQYFSRDDNVTELQDYPAALKNSRMTFSNIIIPVSLEIGKANKRYYAGKFKFGIGGFVGLNLSDIQNLMYYDEGLKVEERIKGNYNSNNLIYGVTTFIGYDFVTLYAKYYLNPLFSSNPVAEHIGGIGIRLTF